MGRGRWELSALRWKTGIEDADAAWNDTFVHPDSTHWLFEGSGLQFPGLTSRVGLTDRTDVWVYFTKNPNANYGFYGAQVQENLVNDDARTWAAAARVSLVSLYGPEDLDFSVYGADLVASRQYGLSACRVSVSPYAGVSASLSRSHEKSAVVTLTDERVFGAQATAGVVVQVAGARLAVEYVAARVPNVSSRVRRRWPRVHRWLGRFYLGGCVLMGGVAGMWLGVHAHSGPATRLGFVLLAMTWLATAGIAWGRIRSGEVVRHREWMWRNYALTWGAVMLRVYMGVSQGLLGFAFNQAYPIVAWLAWVPNLAVTEWLVVRRRGKESE